MSADQNSKIFHLRFFHSNCFSRWQYAAALHRMPVDLTQQSLESSNGYLRNTSFRSTRRSLIPCLQRVTFMSFSLNGQVNPMLKVRKPARPVKAVITAAILLLQMLS